MFKGDFCALRFQQNRTVFAADALMSCLSGLRTSTPLDCSCCFSVLCERSAAVHEPILDLQPATLQLTEPQPQPDQQVCREAQTKRAKQCV